MRLRASTKPVVLVLGSGWGAHSLIKVRVQSGRCAASLPHLPSVASCFLLRLLRGPAVRGMLPSAGRD